jgi:hypothetical protein
MVGLQVVALRANDGTQTAETQPPGSEPGQFPRPFSGAQFRYDSFWRGEHCAVRFVRTASLDERGVC